MGTSIRPNGMMSGAAALRYWERRQEIASHNLANVSTNGFKGERVFARMVEGGLPVPDAVTDFESGTLSPTGNPYDVAIEGRGFFVVQTANGERLWRGGTLQVRNDGVLVDTAGHELLGEHGVIRLSANGMQEIDSFEISRNGVVRVNGKEIDRLRLETIADKVDLDREGAGLFIPPAQRTPLGDESDVVRQGTLEESNVTPISEMVDMIAIQRAYSAVQKAISTLDATREVAVTELGRPVS
jgi:flagellar basal-body rod protein FlgF